MSLLFFAYNEVFSALDAAGGEAGNQVFLNAKEENDDGDRGEQGGCKQILPLNHVKAVEHVDAH